ncbi:MAG: patatin-like phospholipase family protein [Pseudomonadota bacterium]
MKSLQQTCSEARPQNRRIGLALSGGGARGSAHIGVLKALQRYRVTIDEIAGTSAGAVVAAMYAARPDPAWIARRFAEYLESDVFKSLGTQRLAKRFEKGSLESVFSRRFKDHMVVNMSLMREFVIPRSRLEAAFRFLIPAETFSELALPLVVCAADVRHGTPVIYHSGDLINALCNSASIPGVLEADVVGEQVIVDGGVFFPVPVEPLRPRNQLVIASDVNQRRLPELQQISVYSLSTRAENLAQMSLARLQAEQADVTIFSDVFGLHWSQFGAYEELIKSGEAAAEDAMDLVLDRIKAMRSPLGRLKHRLRSWLDRAR